MVIQEACCLEHLLPCDATGTINMKELVVALVREKVALYMYCVMGLVSLKSFVNFVHSLRFLHWCCSDNNYDDAHSSAADCLSLQEVD